MAEMSSLTEAKLPRRMACRVMTEKKHSTRFGQEQPAGTKCRAIRWFCVWVPKTYATRRYS
jgi:hypothetical protein